MSLTKLLTTFAEEAELKIENGKPVIKKKDEVSLKGVLQRGRLKLNREDTRLRRQGITFSPSTITRNYCRRAKIGQMAGQLELFYEKARPSEQITFDVGNMIHDLVQGYFWDIGILKGSFKCLKCDKIYDNEISPQMCPSGIKSHKRSSLKYYEIQMEDKVLPIRGRCDGIVIIEGEEHLMDIKSIQNKTLKSSDRQFCFEDLDQFGPKEDHVIQLNLYMFMSGIHKGHLLYFAKNSGQIKTFEIKYNYNLLAPFVDEIMYLTQAADHVKAGYKIELPAPCGKKDCKCDEVLSIL